MRKSNWTQWVALAVLALGLTSAAAGAHAAEIELLSGGSETDSDRGAFNSQEAVTLLGASWKVTSGSWQVRSLGDGSAPVELTRSFTLFDVPALPAGEVIVAATLTLPHPGNSYDSPDASETVGLWSIDSTSFADLRDDSLTAPGVGDRPDVFVDLGSGTAFGSFESSLASNGTDQGVELNAAALDALNALAHAGGGEWGLGAALDAPSVAGPFGTSERVFRGTGGSFNVNATRLVLTTVESDAPVLLDTGYFLHATNQTSGDTLQSFHFESPQGSHQSYLTGANVLGTAAFVDRRSYFAFQLPAPGEPVTAATLRLWAPAPSAANGGTGVYDSIDASETFTLYPVESHTPAQVIGAPFGDTANHTVDVPIWTDLGDGGPLGSQTLTEADEQNPGLVPSPLADPSLDCSVAGAEPCGRFIEIALNAAGLAELNAALGGDWVVGAALSTVERSGGPEQLWGGTLVDFTGDPALITPAPELLLSTEPINQVPVADAGGDQSVAVGDAVTLDGSASSDPDGDALSYAWTLTGPAGSGAALSDPSAPSPSFTADVPGAYVAMLTVTDPSGDSDSDSVTVTAVNQAPLADAGADQSAAVGDAVTLDGSASSDPDGDALSYAWTLVAPAGSAAALSDAAAPTPSFTADVVGTYEVALTVTDPFGETGTDSVIVTAAQGNQAPIADAGADQAVSVGTAVTLDGSGSSDPDGDALSYAWTFVAPAGSAAVLLGPDTSSPSFVPDVAGEYVATLTVSDPSGASDSDSVAVTASLLNQAPAADAGPDQSASVGDVVALDGSGSSDPDGDALSYAWVLSAPAGSGAALSDPASANPTFTADVEGDYSATLTVSDPSGASDSDEVVVTAGALENRAPVADAGADQSAEPGSSVQLDGSGSFDLDGDALTYAWSLVVPDGSAAALSDPTAVDPTFAVDRAGDYVAALVVTDAVGAASEPDTVVISTENLAPVAEAGPDQTAQPGDVVTLDGSSSSDPNGDPLGYAWTLTQPDGSAGMLSDPSSPTPSFTVEQAGDYVAALVVSDGELESEPDTAVVSSLNLPPVADAGEDRSVPVGETVELDGSGSSDPEGDPLEFVWSLTSVPEGSAAALSDPASSMPSFTADVEGTYVVQLMVSDGELGSEPDSVRIMARAPAGGACRVRYSGQLGDLRHGLILASGRAELRRGEVRGDQFLTLIDRRRRILGRSKSTESLVCSENHAVLQGEMRVLGEGVVDYEIELGEGGRRGEDTYRIRLGNGYDSGELRMRRGDVDIDLRGGRHGRHVRRSR